MNIGVRNTRILLLNSYGFNPDNESTLHGFLKQVNRISVRLNEFRKRQGKEDKFSCEEG